MKVNIICIVEVFHAIYIVPLSNINQFQVCETHGYIFLYFNEFVYKYMHAGTFFSFLIYCLVIYTPHDTLYP